MKKPVQIFPTSMNTYSSFCRERAAYCIGRPDWAVSEWAKVSEREAKEILINLPDELLAFVIEHYGFVKNTSPFNEDGNQTAEGPFEPTEEQTIDHIGDDNKMVEITETPAETPDEESIDIYSMNMNELRKLASELEIKGYTKYDKAELIAEIEKVTAEE